VVSSSKLEIPKNNDIFALQDESIAFSLKVENRLSCDVASYSFGRKTETSTPQLIRWREAMYRMTAAAQNKRGNELGVIFSGTPPSLTDFP
jgi:hypothetical protein